MGTATLYYLPWVSSGFPLATAISSPPKAETRVLTGPQAMWLMAQHTPVLTLHTCKKFPVSRALHILPSLHPLSAVNLPVQQSKSGSVHITIGVNTFLMSYRCWKYTELLT